MEIDIYGDLDNLDNQFEVVQKENEELKETVQKLEETSIKFSKEVSELRRINSNLELNISSLFKTAKAELDRKNKQIAELRKELDNVLFKRGTTRKIPNKRDDNSQEKQNLSTQFEKAQHDLDQRNKIIQSLSTELDNMRKELNEKGNILKRNASQMEEENENRCKAKVPKLDKDTFVENEEDYKNYRNRNERSGNYGSRAKSPNNRNSGNDDLRSQLNLKKINYKRSHSREDFIPNNQRYNRQNYRNSRFTGKYTDYPKKYYRCNNNEERERQNYVSEHNKYDSGMLNFQMPEYLCSQENIPEAGFSTSSIFDDKNIENELEEGEIDKTNLFSDFKSHRVPDINNKRSLQEQSRHDNRKYTVTNISCTESNSSSNKNEKSASEILPNIWESKHPKNEKNNFSSTVVSELNIEKITDKNKSKLDEKKKENISCTDSENVEENVSKTKNEKNKTRKENIENIPKSNTDAVKESTIDETSKIILEKKVKTSKIEPKKEKINSEIKLHEDKKEKSKSIKTKSEKSDSDVSTDLKSTKAKLPAEKKSKSTKSEAKSKQEKEIESNSKSVSETKSSDIKNEKTNSEPKDTNIKLVTEARSNTTKKEKLSETKSSDIKNEKTNSEPKDTNIKLVTEARSNTTKKEKLYETKSSDIKNEKTNSEPKDTNIKLVTEARSNTTKKEKFSETKSVVKNTQSVENNMPTISLPIVDENSNKNKLDKLKSKPNTSTNEKVDENISELQSATIFDTSKNFPADSKVLEIKENNGKQNESDVSKLETTKPAIINGDESSANIHKIETTTEQTDRKPLIKGRRRRCVISIK